VQNIKIIAEGLLFPEGPVALSDGSVLVAEIRGGTIRRVAADGSLSIAADCGGGPNGAAIGPDGALYVCNNGGNTYSPNHFIATGPAADYKNGYIQRVDLGTGEVRVLYEACNGYPLSSPNDLVFDTHGGFYFTDMGKKRSRDRDHGALYYALADGSHIHEVAYQVQVANGVGLSPDGKTVYVAETDTSRLWAFDLVEPGRIRKHGFPSPHGGRLVCGLPGFQRLDSLAVDAEGNICVATLMTGHITVIAPGGEVLRRVKLPDTYVTNICFGGADMRTAYITLAEAGQLVSMQWQEPGLRLNFNA
jgi:gluconolactonase